MVHSTITALMYNNSIYFHIICTSSVAVKRQFPQWLSLAYFILVWLVYTLVNRSSKIKTLCWWDASSVCGNFWIYCQPAVRTGFEANYWVLVNKPPPWPELIWHQSWPLCKNTPVIWNGDTQFVLRIYSFFCSHFAWPVSCSWSSTDPFRILSGLCITGRALS